MPFELVELGINRARINRVRSVFGNCFLLSNSSLSKCSLNELASKGVKFQWKLTLRWLTSLHTDWLVIYEQRTVRIQESIPVGCIPSAAVAISGVRSAQGGVCPGEVGCLPTRIVCLGGFYLVEICPGSVCLVGVCPEGCISHHALPRRCLPRGGVPPVDRNRGTRSWKHHLSATTVADGNNN